MEHWKSAIAMMCVATEFALVGLDLIPDTDRARAVHARLQESGWQVIALSLRQMREFAGNAIELSGRDVRILAFSQRAHDSLTGEQRRLIERSARPVPVSVPTIETAGGSVRCMVAGIHPSPRP